MKKRENERTLYSCLLNAVSLGGDSDTLACITGGIAEAFYGMPQELRNGNLEASAGGSVGGSFSCRCFSVRWGNVVY